MTGAVLSQDECIAAHSKWPGDLGRTRVRWDLTFDALEQVRCLIQPDSVPFMSAVRAANGPRKGFNPPLCTIHDLHSSPHLRTPGGVKERTLFPKEGR
jgi:hypothetical protein